MTRVWLLVAAIHIGYSSAYAESIPDFLSESSTHPAASLEPNQIKVSVYREKKKIFMDAVFLAEKIPVQTISETAAAVSHYDEIKVPGVIQAEPVNDEVFWMHSETMGVHSKDYFLLNHYASLDHGDAQGFSWTPIKKEQKWEFKEQSKFNDFAGYFYTKSIARDGVTTPLVYIRYAMMFDVDSILPAFLIKAVIDYKGEALAHDYVLAIVKAASLKAKAASRKKDR